MSAEPAIEDPGAQHERLRERLGRPSKVAPFLGQIRDWLEIEPRLSSIAIWQRLRDVGCPAGKSAIYAAVKGCRPPKPAEGVLRFERLAAEFSQHDFGQILVRYGDGTQEKGSVENLVGFVKTSFFGAYRFTDREDLLAKLAQWHTWANEQRICRATGQTPAERFMLEEPRLRPLGLAPGGYRLRSTRVVRTDGCCEFETVRFFVGYEDVGQSATLFVGQDEVIVHVGRELVVTHPRRPVNGRFSVRPEQRQQLLTKRGARPYLQRELDWALGRWHLPTIRRMSAPLIEQAYLKASNTNATDFFGWSTDISGGTVVRGARLESSSATGANGDQSDNKKLSACAA